MYARVTQAVSGWDDVFCYYKDINMGIVKEGVEVYTDVFRIERKGREMETGTAGKGWEDYVDVGMAGVEGMGGMETTNVPSETTCNKEARGRGRVWEELSNTFRDGGNGVYGVWNAAVGAGWEGGGKHEEWKKEADEIVKEGWRKGVEKEEVWWAGEYPRIRRAFGGGGTTTTTTMTTIGEKGGERGVSKDEFLGWFEINSTKEQGSETGGTGTDGGWDGSNTLGPIREAWERRTRGKLISLVNLMFPKLELEDKHTQNDHEPLPRLPSGYDVKRLVSEFTDVLSSSDPRGTSGGGKELAPECCSIIVSAAQALAMNARGGYGRGGQEWKVMIVMDEIEKGMEGMGEKVRGTEGQGKLPEGKHRGRRGHYFRGD